MCEVFCSMGKQVSPSSPPLLSHEFLFLFKSLLDMHTYAHTHAQTNTPPHTHTHTPPPHTTTPKSYHKTTIWHWNVLMQWAMYHLEKCELCKTVHGPSLLV